MQLMQSKLFAAVLMVCRFIPIPIVQLVVRIIDIVRAVYMVYQGVKNKSLSMVLGGVASLASGAVLSVDELRPNLNVMVVADVNQAARPG